MNVATGGEFTMNDGTIDHNTGTSQGGGGVSVLGGEFTMNGGTISDNTTDGYGGGVNVNWDFTVAAKFTMNGGTISHNTARYGGGVAVQYSSFTKTGSPTGGTIYGAKKEGSTEDEVDGMKNTSTASLAPISVGHSAVYFVGNNTTKERNTTAGPTISLDGNTGDNWEVP
ncbi:MAG: hypothetical protein LBT00_14550 [Spirochaetaceae bacterium]|nr:hypothetical protein [Spirochaetaceae bacterium]